MRYAFLLLSFFFATALSAFEPYYFSVTAKQGEGIYSLLRKYDLLDHTCNKSKFLELNNLTMDDHLIVGKEYFIPVRIFQYNGLSIRTTIGIENWDQAVRIKKYNEKILKNNLRKTKYEDSNILWVPHHELECVVEDTGEEAEQELTEKPKEDTKKGTYRQIELFGDDHKMVEIVSKDLTGQVFYLVSGHGRTRPWCTMHQRMRSFHL